MCRSDRVRSLALIAGGVGIAVFSHAQPTVEERQRGHEASRASIPEVLVVGSRSVNADIQRTEDDTQPYVVFERAQIERSLAGSLDEFLKTRLPMNTAQHSNNQDINFPNNNSFINLRGLGGNQTLVLVDGRRMPDVTNAGTFTQPDINGIPLSAIERIEVLPSTTSGIYGGGATGGVINITTRKDYTGLDVGLTYGNVFEGDASTRRMDIGAGFNLGQTHAVISASHSESDPLLVGERDFIDRARALQQRNNPDAFFASSTPPFGATTNIRSQDGSNLILDTGVPLDSPYTFVPFGYAGPASDAGTALVANAGRYNLLPPDDVNGYRRSLINNPTVSSASMSLRRAITDRIEMFLDGSWLDNEGRSTQAVVVNSATIPADAPNNPFTAPINVSFPVPGASFVARGDSETVRAIGGVILRLPRDWSIAADHSWSRSRNHSERATLTGDPDGAGPQQSVATALTDGSLDVLRDVNTFALDYSPYLLALPNESWRYDTYLKDATLRVSGPALHLPGGALSVSALVERREQEMDDSFWQFANGTRRFFPSRMQTVDSYYLEARAPLVSDERPLPFLRELELLASIRRDDYETETAWFAGGLRTAVDLPTAESPVPQFSHVSNTTDATKHMFGLRYSPARDVMLRASVGTGFLAPDVSQIAPSPPAPANATVIDPKRGNVRVTYPIVSSAQFNPELAPEESESWSAGVVLTPRWIPGLRLSLDYTSIEKSGEIRFFNYQSLVDLEDVLPSGRVTRQPMTDEDRALGYTGGAITAIDTSYVNIASTRLEAYDIQADYVLPTQGLGDFSVYAVATWQPFLKRQASPLAPVMDSSGFSDGPLDWRGNAGVRWTRGAWTVGWDTQYYDRYRVYFSTQMAASIATAVLNQGSALIRSQTYHDLSASFRFDATSAPLNGLSSGVEIRLGVQNVLNERPPILAMTSTSSSGYSSYGDPRLRRYTVSIRKQF